MEYLRVVKEVPVNSIYWIAFATDLWWLETEKILWESKISVAYMTPEPVIMRPEFMKEFMKELVKI